MQLSSFVEQRPYLFVGTIRENLLLGNDGPVDTEVWAALEMVDLKEVVEARGGLDVELRDRGLNLSEGQRYRLTLCRALLAGSPFLLLDEPFAALDDRSIESVIRAVRAQRGAGVGVVVVTHVLPEELRPNRLVEMP